MMKTEIYIKSNLFPAYPNEEEEINPGRFGRKLGEFVREALVKNGVEVVDLYPTDYGYEMRIVQFDFDVFVITGNVDEEENIDSKENLFLISIDPNKDYVRKFFKKIPTKPVIEKVYNIIMNELLKEKIEIIAE